MPFIVRWPEHVKAGTVSDQTISFTDLLSTFAAITGAEMTEETGPDSFNFLPVLASEYSEEKPIRGPIVMHAGSSSAMMIRSGNWKLINQLGSGGFSTPKTIQPVPGGPKGQLYNLSEDLSETNNLYLDRPDIVEKLTKEMEWIINTDCSRIQTQIKAGI
jgi:arylsulfatase A-like enzyme